MEKIHDNLPQEILQTKAEYRDEIEQLRSRVHLLKGKDKLLMTMYLDNTNSYRQIGRLAGVNVSSVARKINAIAKRLTNKEYLFCLRNSDRFTETETTIAKEHFLIGVTMKKIAERRRWSYYRVRQTIKNIKQVCE